jgi:hypothetical protein
VESVVYELGERMPLERILDLKMPEEVMDDRLGEVWSTDSLLATLALDRGFLTAKAARPDVYRAGSMLLRAFHSSQVAWAFRPLPEEVPGALQKGLWLEGFQHSKGQDIGIIAAYDAQGDHDENTEEAITSSEADEVDSHTSGSGSEDGNSEGAEESYTRSDTELQSSKAQHSTMGGFALLSMDTSDSSSQED